MSDETETTGTNTVLPVPRLTNNPQQDLSAFANWFETVYQALLSIQSFVSSAGDTDLGSFNPNSLPSPGNTSLAQAQATANEAYTLAAGLQVALAAVNDIIDAFGTVTVSNTDTEGTVTFAEAQDDATYEIVLTASAETGTPAAGSATVTKQAKTASGFTITLEAAPGASNSVTFSWILRRSTP